MSKRAADIQLTKNMTNMTPGFNFSAGGNGGRDETMDPASMASSDILSTRKIAPLKRRGIGRGGRGGSSSGGANLPNVFAGVGQGITFGAGGANGCASPSSANSFGGGSFGSVQTPPTQTSFGNGVFSFGQAQQEQSKPDPFTNLAPQAQTNGSTGGIFGGGSFGNPSAPVTNGLFGNTNGAPSSVPPSFGGFGATANDKPATSSFNFVAPSSASSSQPSTTTSNMFGATSTTNAPSPSIPFSFGANSEGDSKPTTTNFTFGQQPAATSAASEPQKTTASAFSYTSPFFGASAQNSASVTTGFGSGLATDAADGNKSDFTFGKFGDPKPSENSSIFGAASAESSAPATEGFFSQKPKDTTPSGFVESNGPIFGFNKDSEKPNEPPKSLFGAPAFNGFGNNSAATKGESPKPTFGGLGATDKKDEQPKPTFGGFGGFGAADKKDESPKPTFGGVGATDKVEQPKPTFGGFSGFGGPNKKDEPSIPSFGVFGSTDKKDEPQKSLFGGFGSPDKKDEPSKSVFSAAALTEKKDDTKSFFGSSITPSVFGISNSTSGGSDSGDSKPVETSAEPPISELKFSAPKFGPPSGPTSTYKPKPFSFPKNPFGLPSSSTSSLPEKNPSSTPSSESNHTAAPDTQRSSLTPATSAHIPRTRSPPLPADSHQWSTNQLTDYYNLYAVRSLNHFFSEQLKKQDVLADLSPLCNAYIDHFNKIRGFIEKNQKYKFGEPNLGSTVPGKRANEDNEERGGKRRAVGEESKAMFTPAKSTSSQALASVLGGFTSSRSPESGSSPKNASIFDDPSAAPSPSTWSNPFKLVDQPSLPDGDIDESDEPVDTPKRTGGLFDRIIPPGDTPMSEPKRTGGLFDRITPPKDGKQATSPSIFASGNQTWTPDKGFKFSTAFNGSGIFGNSNASGNGGSSNSKPNSAVTSTEVSESESGSANDGQPSDMPVTESSTPDLSNQGPGEEDEDSLFEITSRIYDFDPGNSKKLGVVTLRVLKNRINGKTRIIGRNTAGKVIINVALLESVAYKVQRTFLIVPQFLEGGKVKKWACQVKSEKVESLREAVEKAKAS